MQNHVDYTLFQCQIGVFFTLFQFSGQHRDAILWRLYNTFTNNSPPTNPCTPNGVRMFVIAWNERGSPASLAAL